MTHPAEAATFEEIEAGLDADKGAAAGGKGSEALNVKVEGDAVPEAYRGKTVAEILAIAAAANSSLEISEKARREAEAGAAAARAAPAPAALPAPPAPEPEFGAPQFKELYEKDPAEAFMKLQEATEKRLTRNLEGRLVPLVVSATTNAEQAARQQFAEDFVVYGDDIEAFIRTDLNGDRSRIATTKSWGDLIAYVKGRNVEKLFEHRRKKGEDGAKKAAEDRAAGATGFSGTASARRAPPEVAGTQLDATEDAIAAEFVRSGVFKDKTEYSKWKGAAARA